LLEAENCAFSQTERNDAWKQCATRTLEN